jgi:hypothetical protein
VGIKGWLFGNKKRKPAETVAALRGVINRYIIRSRALRRQADEQRSLARDMLKDGNKVAARQALLRRTLYMRDLNNTYNKTMNIQRVIDAIRSAQDNIVMADALKQADDVIRVSLRDAAPERIEEIMMSVEDSIEQVGYTDEILSDTSMSESGLLEDELMGLDSQLEALETELLLEEKGELPTAATRTPAVRTSAKREQEPSPPKEASIPEEDISDEELQREIEAIKKALGDQTE